jgi:hypothetical protein
MGLTQNNGERLWTSVDDSLAVSLSAKCTIISMVYGGLSKKIPGKIHSQSGGKPLLCSGQFEAPRPASPLASLTATAGGWGRVARKSHQRLALPGVGGANTMPVAW